MHNKIHMIDVLTILLNFVVGVYFFGIRMVFYNYFASFLFAN